MYQSKGILYRKRKKQIISFENLIINGKRPTDMDGGYDFYNENCFVFFEFKYVDPNSDDPIEMTDGQNGYYRHLVDVARKGGSNAIAFLCYHNIEDPDEDVDAAETTVVEYYEGKCEYVNGKFKWIKLKNPMKLKDAIAAFVRKYGEKSA